jgi:tagatose-6-phosphate ketose/aldose isomerase
MENIMKELHVNGLHMKEASWMSREIASQPKLWGDTYESVLHKKEEIQSFLQEVYKIKDLQIILTGAGSSAFIGEILQYSFQRNTGAPVKAVPTTDLVTHPGDFFRKGVPVLLISFARSGDSPESLATLELADKLNDTVYHLIITCNAEGELAKAATPAPAKKALVLVLPEGTNDQALAMTSSFTCMLLAGLLISDSRHIGDQVENIKRLIAAGSLLLDKYAAELDVVAALDFKRIVFLGSGPLKGAARESHLKVIELTDGQVNCQYDSFLGFRHGPKAIIDEATLLVYLFSNAPYVYPYETDLVKSINETEHHLYTIGIGQSSAQTRDLNLNLEINLETVGGPMPDDFFSICGVIPAQILGFYKSLALGLAPDTPSKNGGIHRVVQGVTIYPYGGK